VGDFRQQPQANPLDHSVSYAERMGMTWPPALPFAQVLARAKEYDRPAISMLYRRFLPAIYRYVLARVSDVPTAEDITSETFVAMIRGIASTRAADELSFTAWLLGIARNQVLVHFRRSKTHAAVEMRQQQSDGDELRRAAENGDPLLVLMARESWIETANALKLLPEDQQNVVLYRCVLGYSTDDVARMLNKRPGNIRVLQFRAITSLTKQLQGSALTAPERRKHNGDR
jgi:RNA polymerase sigma-70 factor, ECF subfamily